jgi:hypothetical protein
MSSAMVWRCQVVYGPVTEILKQPVRGGGGGNSFYKYIKFWQSYIIGHTFAAKICHNFIHATMTSHRKCVEVDLSPVNPT